VAMRGSRSAVRDHFGTVIVSFQPAAADPLRMKLWHSLGVVDTEVGNSLVH
jgi:hypothetical protein